MSDCKYWPAPQVGAFSAAAANASAAAVAAVPAAAVGAPQKSPRMPLQDAARLQPSRAHAAKATAEAASSRVGAKLSWIDKLLPPRDRQMLEASLKDQKGLTPPIVNLVGDYAGMTPSWEIVTGNAEMNEDEETFVAELEQDVTQWHECHYYPAIQAAMNRLKILPSEELSRLADDLKFRLLRELAWHWGDVELGGECPSSEDICKVAEINSEVFRDVRMEPLAEALDLQKALFEWGPSDRRQVAAMYLFRRQHTP